MKPRHKKYKYDKLRITKDLDTELERVQTL